MGGWGELGGSRRTRDITDRTPEISSQLSCRLCPPLRSLVGRLSRGATIWGRKGARETAKGSDRYNRNAHTFKEQNSEWNFERASRIETAFPVETSPRCLRRDGAHEGKTLRVERGRTKGVRA